MSVEAARKCLSFSDLQAIRHLQEQCQANSTVGGCRAQSLGTRASDRGEREENKPIKRSRSDQSLTTGVLLGCTNSSHEYSLAVQYGSAGIPPSPFVRCSRPTLPVVLSDHGSNNSLISMESELTRSSTSVPGLYALLSAASTGALARSTTPAHAVRMTQASSAVSLTQAQAGGWADLTRGSSVTSIDALSTDPPGQLSAAAATGDAAVQATDRPTAAAAAAPQLPPPASLDHSSSAASTTEMSPSSSPLQQLRTGRVYSPPPVISPSPVAAGGQPLRGGSISISSAKGLTGPHLSAEGPLDIMQQRGQQQPAIAASPPGTSTAGRGPFSGSQVAPAPAAAAAAGEGAMLGSWRKAGASVKQLPSAALEFLQQNLLRPATVAPKQQAPGSAAPAGAAAPGPNSESNGQPSQQQQQQQQQQQPSGATALPGSISSPGSGVAGVQGRYQQLQQLQSGGGSGPLVQLPRISRVASSENTWAFSARRTAAVAAPSGSAAPGLRRRSSLEVTMPWRAQLEDVIAAAHATQDKEPHLPAVPSIASDDDEDNDEGELSQDDAVDRLDMTAEGAAAISMSARSSKEQQHGGSAVGTPTSTGRRSFGSRFGTNSTQQNMLRAVFGEQPGGSDTSGSFARGRSSMERSSHDSSELSSLRDGSQDAGDTRRHSNASAGSGPRPSSYYNSSSTPNGAALELFVRLNRARQTLDFAKRQSTLFADLNRAEMDVWTGLEMLNGLREYEAALMSGASPPEEPLDPDLPLREHAFQVAELCRMTFPDKPWMHLVGLLHGLGKLLAHESFGGQQQWAVAGESYPLGCRFVPQISHCEYFSANPDRRRRMYSTPCGIYQPGCGLKNVYMSWGAPEYLYMMLVLNQVALPEEALFIIRFQRCFSLVRPGGAYRQLMSPEDVAMLPLLAAFQKLSVYQRVVMPPGVLRGEAFVAYYQELIERYLGPEPLFW